LASNPLPGVSSPSLALSLSHSSAVWCTNWNGVQATDFEKMSADGYSSPLIVNSDEDFFLKSKSAYKNATQSLHLSGCTSDEKDSR